MGASADPNAALKAAGLASWHDLVGLFQSQPLFAAAIGAMACVLLGGILRRHLPMFAGFLRFCGNLTLIGVMLVTMARVAHFSLGDTVTIPGLSAEDQTVSGGETRVRMAPDGHFWVHARINGVARRFLVDTGATLTTLSPEAADAAAVPAKRGEKVRLTTANGETTADLVVIDRLQVGNIRAGHLEAVVAPGLGETNVLGMNFLSRLASWRVEDHTLILVAHHPVTG